MLNMINETTGRLIIGILIMTFLMMNIAPLAAEPLSPTPPSSGVLISKALSTIDNLYIREKSLVVINAIDNRMLLPKNGSLALGTENRIGQGVIIDHTGVIATNKHVIGDNPKRVNVMLYNGKTYVAHVLMVSATNDLAFIKIDTDIPLRAVLLADSSTAAIGNFVVAVANGDTNPEREFSGQIIQVYRETRTNKVAILEVNIPLKPGDSGGPILNDQGLLLGLIMANQISDNTKSYAIASNTIQEEYMKHSNSSLISKL